MPDETPEITVSHADLDAALEERAAEGEAAEETVEDEPETPEPETEQAISSDPDQDAEPEEDPEEPDDHKERSKLGRRVSGLEHNINLLVEKIDQLVTSKTEPEEDPDDDEPVFMTKKQLREFVRNQAKDEVKQTKAEEHAAQVKYERAYVAQVRKVGANLPPKQLEAVFKEMFEHHNDVFHKIPEVDADINFHRAVASLADKAKPKKVVPLKKDDPKNLGGPADTKIEGKKVAPQKLDEHAAAFVKYHNLSDEKVKEALEGETRPSLRGKFG